MVQSAKNHKKTNPRCLVTPIYAPCRPFGRGTTLLRGLKLTMVIIHLLVIQDIHEMSTGHESLNETKGHRGRGGPYRSWGLEACHWVMLLLLMVQKSCVKNHLREWWFYLLSFPGLLASQVVCRISSINSMKVRFFCRGTSGICLYIKPSSTKTCEQPTSPITEYIIYLNMSFWTFWRSIQRGRSIYKFLPQRRSNWKPF